MKKSFLCRSLILLGTWIAFGIFLASIGWASPLPRPERELLLRLQQAQECLAEGRLAEVLPILEQIFSTPRWGYVPVAGQENLYLPVERAAAMLVESLPPEAQANWEAWCAAKASRHLDEAVQQRNTEALRQVAIQYPATRFAAEAALLLAADAFDHRRWPEVIRWAEKIHSAPWAPKELKQQALLLAVASHLCQGRPTEARQSLGQLEKLGLGKGVQLAGQKLPSATTPQNLIDLLNRAIALDRQPAATEAFEPQAANWPMFRGDATRNRSSDWQGPIGQLRWRIEMEAIEEFAGPPFEGGKGPRFSIPGAYPAAHPLLTEQLALVRLPTRLVAVDIWTGRQKWEFPPGGDAFFSKIQGERVLPGGVIVRMHTPQAILSRQRIFDDAPYGQMVVWGNRLFLLDYLLFPGPSHLSAFGVQGSPGPSRPSYNRLVALDLRKEGKVLWSVGGASGEDEPALAGVFFMGPPLPLEGLLFALAEQGEQIRLVAIDEATGRLQWSLPLATPERIVIQDSLRRLAGATPSYADGVLVCPTSAGVVVGVDPWTRSVLWAYETALTESVLPHRPMRVILVGGARIVSPEQEYFSSIDSTATIVSPYVLIAPVEADLLFCLDLFSGRLCWQRAVEGFRYVAAVVEGVALTIGDRKVSGWQLRTGKPAWEELYQPLPEGYTMAGRGFRQGRLYYLPVVRGETSALLPIDIPTGRLGQPLELPTKTRIGNLAAAGKTLVSFSSEGVEAFGPEKP
ncbi:MAG: PQQ-like beta-propeller repeat protein [Thermoguttaceae bacterium]|nr:PQQ-like beta-propeller repeat protein [Thermoguttaceae bacterium]